MPPELIARAKELGLVEVPKELTSIMPQIPKSATLKVPQETKTTFHVHVPIASLMAVEVYQKMSILPSMIVQVQWVYGYEESIGGLVVKENEYEMLVWPENEEPQTLQSFRRVFSDFDCGDESPAEYKSETTNE